MDAGEYPEIHRTSLGDGYGTPRPKPRKGSSGFFGVATGCDAWIDGYFRARPLRAQAPLDVARETRRDGLDGCIDLALDQRPVVGPEGQPVREALLGLGQWAASIDVEQRDRPQQRTRPTPDRRLDIGRRRAFGDDDREVALDQRMA